MKTDPTATPLYRTILVTLEGSAADRTIIDHVKSLARCMHSRVALLHVADGWAARMFGPDAISAEVAEDKAYLEKVRAEFQSADIPVEAELAFGEPAKEIVKWVETRGCDLVAMSTHGHRFVADLFLGSTSRHVRHRIRVPVLLLRAK
jgi:nucleotide-binding universal stress UspA family protein